MPKDNSGNNPYGGDNWSDAPAPVNQINSNTPTMDQMDGGHSPHTEGPAVPAPEQAIEFDYEN